MEQTLQALSGLLQKAVPTVLLLLFLHFYLRVMLFGPLKKIRKERDELTKGTRKAAEESLAAAERKTQEYEVKMREARAEVYREQEEMRKRWLADQAAQIEESHSRNAEAVTKAKSEIATEAALARQNLTITAGSLADEIAGTLLARRQS